MRIGAHEVGNLERRLAKEVLGALLFEDEQRALDGTDRGRGDVAVMGGKLGTALGDVTEERAQILEIEKQKPLVIGQFEGGVEDAFLGGVEVKHAREQQRAHLGNRGADRMALTTEEVPEDGGKAFEGVVGKPIFSSAGSQEILGFAGL